MPQSRSGRSGLGLGFLMPAAELVGLKLLKSAKIKDRSGKLAETLRQCRSCP